MAQQKDRPTRSDPFFHPDISIDRLMIVILQIQDERRAIRALNRIGLRVTRLSSSGAFLGRRNVTLLIGFPQDRVEEAVQVIHENCHERVEYVSTPLEGAPLPIPLSTPIVVGGATVFTLSIDRYQEL
jgi:uncharacterized protein YaaQ